MSQPPHRPPERRSEPRRPAAFAFWFRHKHTPPAAGWMLNLSRRGAAFLAAAEQAPRVGQRLELSEMHSSSRAVREAADALPGQARVLRIDDPDALTRRVAVRFELGRPGRLGGGRQGLRHSRLAEPVSALLAARPGDLPSAGARVAIGLDARAGGKLSSAGSACRRRCRPRSGSPAGPGAPAG